MNKCMHNSDCSRCKEFEVFQSPYLSTLCKFCSPHRLNILALIEQRFVYNCITEDSNILSC